MIWKLRKPLYGLDDANRKFWLKIKDIFNKEGLTSVIGNEAFYCRHKDDKLEGMVLSHVDDFSIAGKPDFVEGIISKVHAELTVLKIERDSFRFT